MQQMWQIKQMIALAMLAVCSYTDIKEINIYIAPLVISVTGGILTVLTAFWGIPDYGGSQFVNELVSPALAGMLLIAVLRSCRKHIGLGDGYLLACLGILIGNRRNMYVIVIASVAASVYGTVLMLKKRKHRAGSIPFAPFVMSGFMMITMTGVV